MTTPAAPAPVAPSPGVVAASTPVVEYMPSRILVLTRVAAVPGSGLGCMFQERFDPSKTGSVMTAVVELYNIVV